MSAVLATYRDESGPPPAPERYSEPRLRPISSVSSRNNRRRQGRRRSEAVAHENVAIVAMLLDHGADATTIGAGRWVAHPELAPILSRAGARVDRSGNWIQLSCTANQGRKDDPEYVAALLRHGARVDERRETVQMTDGGRATSPDWSHRHLNRRTAMIKTIATSCRTRRSCRRRCPARHRPAHPDSTADWGMSRSDHRASHRSSMMRHRN
jgi:hypothetical protein